MNNKINTQKYQSIYEKEIVKLNKRFNRLFINKEPKSLYEPSSYIVKSGGKRLRPFLVLASAKAVGAKFSDVYNAAMAVELLHNFTLVHDDIMDNAEKRRGKPTIHKIYDESTAILTGDNLTAYSYKSLLKDCKNNCVEVVNTFTQGIIEVCEGQSFDELFEIKNNVSISDYKKMIFKKTASLSGMCCSIGAQLGRGSKEEVKSLFSYGKNLGMAFQIKDDFLDIFGDEKKFGKLVGGDLLEGKKTYLLLRALEKAKGKNKKSLQFVIKNNGISKSQIQHYKNIYLELGVDLDAKKEIKNYTKRALQSLKILKDKESIELLTWLANSLIGRNN